MAHYVGPKGRVNRRLGIAVFTIASAKMKGLTTPTTLEGSPWNANTWSVS